MKAYVCLLSSWLDSLIIKTILSWMILACAEVSYAQSELHNDTIKSIPKELLSVGDDDDVMRFNTVDQCPTFPGGQVAWSEWLSKNIEYPYKAREERIGGKEVITFIVEKDGSITDIWVKESIHPAIDKEAIRMAKKMPKWIPGYFNGSPVRVRYDLPIIFELTDIPTTMKEPVLVAPEDHNDENLRVRRQKTKVSGFDNNSFYVSFFSGCDVYSGHGQKIYAGKDSVISVKNNPTCNGFITLFQTNKGHQYAVISHYHNGNMNKKTITYKKISLTAACYRPDARQLAIARSDKKIELFNAVNDTLLGSLQSSIVPQHMIYSDDGHYLAVAEGGNIEIWNMERGTVRKSLTTNSMVNDLAFVDNSRKMLVVTGGGQLIVYETSTFTPITKYEGLGSALRCCGIGDSKYAAVLVNDKTTAILNLLDNNDVTQELIGHGNTTNIGTAVGLDGDHWLIYNSNIDLLYSAIGYSRIKDLKPYYNKMMENELTVQLNQWMKMMPNETLEEYQQRVNDESRTAMTQQLALNLATKMAEGVIEESTITMGDYNTSTGQLVLHMGKMPDIYITVPSDEIAAMGGLGSNIKLENVKYMLTESDQFEIAYAKVVNPTTGKTYVYDKMKMEPLAFNQADINLVPLDIIMKTNMEEVSLMNIKDEVVSLAKQEQIISDKTHISVVAQASKVIDADGKPIYNYDIDFTYEVEEEFSARDDFKSGRFHTEESGAAMSMLKIMKKAFETDFAKYVKAGKRVRFSITGSADASPILRTLAYDGEYGEYQNEPVYRGKELTTLTLTKKDGISDNDQLAFARAIGVQQYLERELESFSSMKREYDYHIDVSENKGSKYRRISVQCSFIDAF